MEPLLTFLAVAAFAVFTIFLWNWHFTRSRRMVEGWARANGLRLLMAQRRWLGRGPFWWRTGRGQEVFYVTVRHAAGDVRHAYVRVGGWWWGMMTHHVAVEWV